MSVGKKLRRLRLDMKRTLKEQSEVFGVTLNSISRWEHDLAVPRKKTLKKMAAFYNVPLSWLLKDDDEESGYEYAGHIPHPEGAIDQKLHAMFDKLSDMDKYRVLGYIEHIFVEYMK